MLDSASQDELSRLREENLKLREEIQELRQTQRAVGLEQMQLETKKPLPRRHTVVAPGAGLEPLNVPLIISDLLSTCTWLIQDWSWMVCPACSFIRVFRLFLAFHHRASRLK
jgi:hypothetical protein